MKISKIPEFIKVPRIEQRNDDSPLSMHKNVTLNSPSNEEYNYQYQQSNLQYPTTPSFPNLILNHFCSPHDGILCSTTTHLQKLEEEEEEEEEIWTDNFMELISTVINYSENLENISNELLRTEGKVRQLVLLQKSLIEELQEKEKIFQDRIDECNDISNQQLDLIDHLIDLEADLNEFQHPRQEVSTTRRTTITTASTIDRWQSSEHSQQEERSLNSDTTVNSKFLLPNHYHHKDILNKIRWHIGVWIGGSVSTGNVLHSFENTSDGSIELIIAGSGTIATPKRRHHSIHLHKHNYMIHINRNDCKSQFHLLPKHLWIADELVNQCQFPSCSTLFSIFKRRHHCRKCGFVICQRHSLNRLPLFIPSSSFSYSKQWHRVCDTCFHDLVIVK